MEMIARCGVSLWLVQINKETIEQLFRQHYLRMYQLARVLLKDDAASKDVVSEFSAFIRREPGVSRSMACGCLLLPSTRASRSTIRL